MLKQLIHKIFQYFGFDIIRYTKENFISLKRLSIIRSRGINLVLDVGASEGHYALGLRKMGYEGRIISFEPLSSSFKILQKKAETDPSWCCENLAIGNYDGVALINVSGRRTSSSILPMLPSHVAAAPESAYITKEQVQMRRLDSLLNDLITRENRIYIKIDVQGYERSVLEGAEEILKITEVIEVEVSMVPLYEGSILYAEMISKLDSIGFYLISWEDVLTNPQTGYVLQSDCIFTRAFK